MREYVGLCEERFLGNTFIAVLFESGRTGVGRGVYGDDAEYLVQSLMDDFECEDNYHTEHPDVRSFIIPREFLE